MKKTLSSPFLPVLSLLALLAAPLSAMADGAAVETEAAPAADTVAEVETAPAETEAGGGAGVEVAPAAQAGFDTDFGGYLRSTFTFIDHDPAESEFIGRNDGFGMAHIRVGVKGSRDRVRYELSLDGAVNVVDSSNTSRGEVAVRIADAWAGYEIVPGALELQFGQQKVPFDGESLIATAELPFVSRSVWNRGVRGVEGWNVDGLGVDRQVGITLAGESVPVGGPLALSYYLAVTNGTSAYRMLNENQSVATYGRLEAHIGDMVTVGGGGYHNMRTYGETPNLLDERHFGIAADVMADIGPVWIRGDFVQRQIDYPDVEAQLSRVSRGFGGSVGYRAPLGLEPVYRLAFFDPTAVFPDADPALAAQLEANDLMYHTVGLTWIPENQPLALQLNYTLAGENAARAIRNDRLEVLGRLVF